jgi:predicted RNA methylase
MLSYSDSEVAVFHPICEEALKKALRLINRDSEYEVIHHRYTGSLEMDFVIENTATGKYLCVIEVKRTPADVNSTRYQYQAMSYVQMNAGITEKPYYVITNLEKAISFRYDSQRPRVFQQMLKPGLVIVGDFSSFSSNNQLIEALSMYFKGVLECILADDFEYFLTLGSFANTMEAVKSDSKKWKSSLALMLYEYIRGAFEQVGRRDLHDIRLFRGNIQQICDEASNVDFEGIFNYCASEFEPSLHIPSVLLAELFDYGYKNITGDSIAGVLHSIVSDGKEHLGEVATDLELARLVAELAYSVSGNIEESKFICDPAAGSGNLISASITPYNLKSYQILANDCNDRLLELLSLRLGLNFSRTINKDEAPKISCLDITNMPIEYFDDVNVIIMNPPFVAGINCVDRKKAFFKAIKDISGSIAMTDTGQMPLEAVFLELISNLVRIGTVIACVFPKTHLVARGEEAVTIRRLLLTKFGLKKIFIYPGDGIFKDVIKDTCVIVGVIGQQHDDIDIITSTDDIPNLDGVRFCDALTHTLTSEFTTIAPGVMGKKISRTILDSDINNGWRKMNIEMVDAISFVNSELGTLRKLKELSEYNYPIRRGAAGNSGGSDLLFLSSNKELYSVYKNRLSFAVGMKNAKSIDTMEIGTGDNRFTDSTVSDPAVLEELVVAYSAQEKAKSKQARHAKSPEQWRSILEAENKRAFPENTVLIPRAIRADGRAFLSKSKVFVSTNFVACSLPSYERALILASWMTTIFYQLICEVSSKDQEGMRKMEVADIMTTLVPNFDMLSTKLLERIRKEKDNITFLKLKDPQIREIDRIWAIELFDSAPLEKLDIAVRLLRFLANRRDS